MKSLSSALLLFGILLVVGIAIAIPYFFNRSDQPVATIEKVAVAPPSTTSSLPIANNTLQGQLIPLSGGASNTTSNTPRLPAPQEFSEYEQYSDETSTLFQELLVGTGDEASAGDTVALLYSGWLTNGQLFDKTRTNEADELEPFVFELGARQVIPGWDQGIGGMKVGGIRRLVVPAVAGYGADGQGPIPPNAMLIFDVELVQVLKEEDKHPGI